MGGLGNQMFQYAIYRLLAINNLNVFLDTRWYYSKNRLAHEKFKLNYFDIKDINFLCVDETHNLTDYYSVFNLKLLLNMKISKIILLKTVIFKIIRKFCNLLKIDSKCFITNYYENENVEFDLPFFLNNTKNLFIVGIFARYKHIEVIRQQLLNDFSFKKPLPEKVINILDDIKKKKSAAIHVRCGDYIGDNIRDICGMTYYRNSIQYLSSKQTDLFYYIFSDDTEYIKNNFSFLENYYIIDNSVLNFPDYFDLFLMTQVNHIIISNSTFGWWAAWLNSNPEKMVIVPERYHADNSWVSSNKLFPSEWIQMAVN
jgi:hypothetical protein